MCGNEANGADAADWQLRPYLITVREEGAPPYTFRVDAALGKHDAENQARERAREHGIAFDVISVEAT